MRRPLADTIAHNDSSSQPLESKTCVSHTDIETRSIKSESCQEDRTIRVVNSIKKLMQTETNYNKGKHFNIQYIVTKLLRIITYFINRETLRS